MVESFYHCSNSPIYYLNYIKIVTSSLFSICAIIVDSKLHFGCVFTLVLKFYN